MKYTETHEWIKIEGDEAIVGITFFAQKELGDIVYIELPKVGKSVKKGEEIVVLESTKAAADVYSPLSGVITSVNEHLNGRSELVNQAPESEGWLFKLKFTNSQELSTLLDLEAYRKISH